MTTTTTPEISASGVVKCQCGRRFLRSQRHTCDFYDNSGSTIDPFGGRDFTVTARPGDSIDPPERNGSGQGGGGGGRWSTMDKSNRYPGECVRCGGWVEAGVGRLVKDNAKQTGGTVWGVEHASRGECIATVMIGELGQPVESAKPNAISEKQEGFLRSLIARKAPDADADKIIETLNTLPNPKQGASAAIDSYKSMPDAPKPKAAKVDEPELIKGDVHVVDGSYYRVHVAQGSGNLYACKWDGERFDYERGAISRLNPGNKITAEQAAEFGHMFERCCFCSTAIDTPESTAVGYGPKCAAKQGLPWG